MHISTYDQSELKGDPSKFKLGKTTSYLTALVLTLLVEVLEFQFSLCLYVYILAAMGLKALLFFEKVFLRNFVTFIGVKSQDQIAAKPMVYSGLPLELYLEGVYLCIHILPDEFLFKPNSNSSI